MTASTLIVTADETLSSAVQALHPPDSLILVKSSLEVPWPLPATLSFAVVDYNTPMSPGGRPRRHVAVLLVQRIRTQFAGSIIGIARDDHARAILQRGGCERTMTPDEVIRFLTKRAQPIPAV